MADLVGALVECHLLRGRGINSAIGFWHRIQRDSTEVAAEYLTSLFTLSVSTLDCYLSIKPLGLAFRRDLLMDIMRRAHRMGVRVHFDSPTEEAADITLSAIDEGAAAYDNLGCTLPGRWQRSLQDAEWAIARGLAVRVVKGQWPDAEDPARDSRTGFLALIDTLAGRARHVAVATHDTRLIADAVRRLNAAGTPCEVELLAGHSADDPLRAARRAGAPVRAYVAYGDEPMPYGAGGVTPPVRATPASSPQLLLRSDARAHA